MLKVDHLTFGPARGKTVGTDFCAELLEGEIAVITGASGVGKTTLLRAVAGMAIVSGGAFFYDGTDMTTAPLRERKLAYMEQDFPLFDELTVAENIQLRDVRLGRSLTEAAVAKAEFLIRSLGLPAEFVWRRPSTLSGGERQRVALARVLASERRLLLLDEPFSNLDRSNKSAAVRAIIDYVRRTRAIALVVCHDDADALLLGDILILPPFAAEGRIVKLREQEDLHDLGRETGYMVPGGIQELSGAEFGSSSQGARHSQTIRFISTEAVVARPGEALPPGDFATAEARIEKQISTPLGVLSIVRLSGTGRLAVAFTASSNPKALPGLNDHIIFAVPLAADMEST